MSPPVEISDEFGKLSLAERSEKMTSLLSQYADHMLSNNKRIFSRMLDMIEQTDGDETLHLNMVATLLAQDTSEVVDVRSWPDDNEDCANITRLSEFRARSHLGNDPGICHWVDDKDHVSKFLQELLVAVRQQASRDLLGTAVDSIQLPSEFCEFLKQTGGVVYPNLDRQMFICSFGTTLYDVEEQAEPLPKMCRHALSNGFEVAAGWKAGDNGRNCWIYYLLCKDLEKSDEPWRWRIFINNIDHHDAEYYDSLHDFLSWYSSAYEWVDWDAVQRNVEDLHFECQEALPDSNEP